MTKPPNRRPVDGRTRTDERRNLIKVSVEVSGVAGSFRADVWAESVVQAIDLVNARHPGCEAKVLFPIDPDTFLAKGSTRGKRIVRSEILQATG